ILERGAERIAGVPQLRHVAHEAEGARAREFAAECLRLDVERERLQANQRMIELDVDLDAEAMRMRPQLAIGIFGGDANRLENLQISARRRERDEAGLIDRRNERSRAAVH